MRALHQALRQRGDAGEELPLPWDKLSELGVSLKRGQVSIVAAGPGKGKSLFALNLVLGMAQPALVMSGDSDAFTVGVRTAAWKTGHSITAIEKTFETGDDHYLGAITPTRQFARFDFRTNPTAEDIRLEMEAFALTFGEWPHLMVLDNLGNILVSEDEWQNLRQGLDFLHEMARDTGTHVMSLHHLEGTHDDGDQPPRLSSLRGKVSKVPEVVLGLFGTSETHLGVSVLKNRSGPASAIGELRTWLRMDYSKARVYG